MKKDLKKPQKSSSHFQELIEIMRILRSPKGCPWDREQTLKSLKPYMVEECYEVWEAIDTGDPALIKEELGDLLFQIVFSCQITKEKLGFDMEDVAKTVKEKMTRRHPHVFGKTKVKNSDEVLSNWELIKKQERHAKASVLDGIPKHLPALLKAHRTQAKASRVGFDWNKVEEMMDKLEEEYGELKEAYREGNIEHVEEEMGDLLFSIVNVARGLKINPEDALHKTIRKFTKRFQYIEKKISERGEKMEEKSLKELDKLWDEAKSKAGR